MLRHTGTLKAFTEIEEENEVISDSNVV